MPHFAYTAYDARGAETRGTLEAAGPEPAALALKARGLFPTSLVTAAATARDRPAPPARATRARELDWEIRLPFVRPVSEQEQAVFTRQLATLLRAGMPLLRGLEVLARQERNRALRAVIGALGEDLRSGGALSEALARHPRVFDRLHVNMVKAGEAGGVLDVVLDRLAGFAEKRLALRAKVGAALVYPLIVLIVAGLILAGLLVFVVPKFEAIFADLLKGAPLPPLTRAVLAVSTTVRENFFVVLGLGVAAWAGLRALRRTPVGARWVDGVVVRLPVFGGLILKALVARFARTLGTLLAGGVPMLQALVITRDTSANTRVADALAQVHDRVRAGDPVAGPLEATGVFPAMVASLIEVGEQTGQLPAMLTKVADIYDGEVDHAVAGLSSLLEPILIVFLAGVVGTIVIALFLPIVRIVQLMT